VAKTPELINALSTMAMAMNLRNQNRILFLLSRSGQWLRG
jgi:hypothetical protein